MNDNYNEQCKKCRYLSDTSFLNDWEWDCNNKNHKYKYETMSSPHIVDIFMSVINEDNDCKFFKRKRFLGIF